MQNGQVPPQERPPDAVPMMEPRIIDLTMSVASLTTAEGKHFVRLAMATPAGTNFYFIESDKIDGLCDILQQAGMAAKSGLVIPQGMGDRNLRVVDEQ